MAALLRLCEKPLALGADQFFLYPSVFQLVGNCSKNAGKQRQPYENQKQELKKGGKNIFKVIVYKKKKRKEKKGETNIVTKFYFVIKYLFCLMSSKNMESRKHYRMGNFNQGQE